jgi:antitoxin component of MazEF toxin-antitoxin module
MTSPLKAPARCNYSNHTMSIVRLKIARIGNSRGVRLPAASLRRYRIGEAVLMEERSDGILLRPIGPAVEKLSWADTAREMAASREDWAEWDAAAADGMDAVPWSEERVAEPVGRYRAKAPRRKRR